MVVFLVFSLCVHKKGVTPHKSDKPTREFAFISRNPAQAGKVYSSKCANLTSCSAAIHPLRSSPMISHSVLKSTNGIGAWGRMPDSDFDIHWKRSVNKICPWRKQVSRPLSRILVSPQNLFNSRNCSPSPSGDLIPTPTPFLSSAILLNNGLKSHPLKP